MLDGQMLRLKGKGAPGRGAGGPGDALIRVEVLPDPRFEQEGANVIVELPVSLSEAVLGGEVRAPTPTGDVMLTIPSHSSSGATLRLKGKGAPRREGGFGDELVKLESCCRSRPIPSSTRSLPGGKRARPTIRAEVDRS